MPLTLSACRLLRLLRVSLLPWLLPLPVFSQIVLTEFMADNASTLRDEDGDSADWIELTNTGGVAVNLEGYALTNDPSLAARWSFPIRMIQPGEYLTVFASSKNRANPAGNLHTSFKLAKEGGHLALLAPDGSLVQEFPAYPAQTTDVSYGRGMTLATPPLKPVVAGAACKWRCPTTANQLVGWQELDFVETGWTSATTGIGYDTVTTDTTYAPLFGTTGSSTQTAMRNTNPVCYLRVPFTVADARQVARLTFRLKYDDGFVLWLNGVKVASDNAPDTPAYDSVAPASRPNSMAVVFRDFDLTPRLSLLKSGSNVLAIQGLNYADTSVDFLLVPELQTDSVNHAASATSGFLSPPTPGFANGSSFSELIAPVLSSAPRGFVSGGSVAVALSCDTPGAQIRYTTTGAVPTATTGSVYSAPLGFSTNTVLRAAAFKTGARPSPVATFSYLFPAATVAQSSSPAIGGSSFPGTWGSDYNPTTGEPDTSSQITADYAMDTTVTGASAYQALMVPALTNTLPVVSLSFDRDLMFGTDGIYANRRDASGEGAEVPVSVEYFNPLVPSEQFALDAGVRMHGGNARDHPKKPLRIHFRSQYGASKLNYPLFPGSPVESFDTLILRGGGHDSWGVPFGGLNTDLGAHGTYLRDQFLRRTETEAGLLSPRGRYVHVFLDGLYWGVYDLHERAGDSFFAEHLGGSKEDYDVVKHRELSSERYGLAAGSNASWEAALSLASDGKLSATMNYHFFRELVDVDNLSDHLIVRMWAGDYDWMAPLYRGDTSTADVGYFSGKNWYSGRRSRGDRGKFQFFCWDAEMSMGNHLMSNALGGAPAQRVTNFDQTRITGDYDDDNGIGDGNPAQLYEQLRSNAEFRRSFGDRVHRMLVQSGGKLTATVAQARLDDMKATLNLPIVAESARWGDVNDADTAGVAFTRDVQWASEVAWLRNTFTLNRATTVAGQFRKIGLLSSVTVPAFSVTPGQVAVGTSLSLSGPAGSTVRYTTDGTDPWLGETVSPVPLVSGSTQAQWLVPPDSSLGATWLTVAGPANLTTWFTGRNGFGSSDSGGLFAEFIDTPVTVSTPTPSLYVRYPFSVGNLADVSTLSRLFLRVRYDDGIVVYLNGVEVARRNAPTTPVWNSTATLDRPDKAVSILYENIDLTTSISKLMAGQNVLAVQVLGRPASSSELLLDARLEGYRITAAGISPAAQIFTGSFPLNRSQTVKARAFTSSTTFSALGEARYLVGTLASVSNLVVGEFSYRPAPVRTAAEAAVASERSAFEFIELKNISAGPVDLSDIAFTAGVECVLTGENTLLQAGQSALVVNNLAAFTARYGANASARVAAVFNPGLSLSNTGETVTLLAANGAVIKSFAYSNLPPWPTAADGQGYTLELVNPASNPDHNDPASWRASLDPAGTPGTTPEGNSFAAWREASFNPDAADFAEQAAAAADPDADGRPNLLEFALGSNPLLRESSAPLVFAAVASGGKSFPGLSFRTRPGAAGLAIIVEATDDFGSWSASGVVLESSTPNADGTETRVYRSTVALEDSARRFLRLRVTSDNP